MEETIKNKAKELGADLVSVLNLKDYKSQRSPNPLRYLPSAKSIVLLAFAPLAGAYRYQENTWSKMPSFLYSVESAGNTAAYHLGKFMERELKAESFLVQAHRPFEINEETFRSPIGSISLRHAAVQSGLAVWGKNTLALTPQFGPRVMFLGLLNSLDLKSDLPIQGYDPCLTCKHDCRSTCPGKAFTEDGRVQSHRCVKVSQPDDVGNFMRFLIEMAAKPSMEERLEMMKSPRFFRHLQYLQFFIHYRCDNCTRYCPGDLAGPHKN
ncbi:MAG: epoxyqueuosine reductase [Deltaproteobacteria bacterium]|nr:epoxyqueuosine reductase [Deltaproteobacteria bacterium]